MSLWLARLLATPLALFVCMRSRLLVLLSLRVNSPKLRRLALDEVDCRLSVELRCRTEGDPGVKLKPVPSSESRASSGVDEEARIVARCGWLCVLWVMPGRLRFLE